RASSRGTVLVTRRIYGRVDHAAVPLYARGRETTLRRVATHALLTESGFQGDDTADVAGGQAALADVRRTGVGARHRAGRHVHDLTARCGHASGRTARPRHASVGQSRRGNGPDAT